MKLHMRYLAGSAIAACIIGGAAAAQDLTKWYADPAQPDISGIWLAWPPSPAVQTTSHRPLPLTPKYKAIADERTVAREAGKTGKAIGNPMENCEPAGNPVGMIANPYPKEIIQTPGQVLILAEPFGIQRRIPLSDEYESEIDDYGTYIGTSKGAWSGDTLQVTTEGIRANTPMNLRPFDPHSGKLAVTEEFTRIDDKTLRSKVTFTDEDALLEPYVVTVTYTKVEDYVMQEWFCVQSPVKLN